MKDVQICLKIANFQSSRRNFLRNIKKNAVGTDFLFLLNGRYFKMASNPIIDQLEKEQIRNDIPEFDPGDTVRVEVKVVEGEKSRLQAFEGNVIAKRNRGLNSSFTVRKMSSGEGVERVFQTHSPLIASITVTRRGDVRRAKLYYLRERTGKSARIREKIN